MSFWPLRLDASPQTCRQVSTKLFVAWCCIFLFKAFFHSRLPSCPSLPWHWRTRLSSGWRCRLHRQRKCFKMSSKWLQLLLFLLCSTLVLATSRFHFFGFEELLLGEPFFYTQRKGSTGVTPIVHPGCKIQNKECNNVLSQSPGCGNTRLVSYALDDEPKGVATSTLIIIFSCTLHEVLIIRPQVLISVITLLTSSMSTFSCCPKIRPRTSVRI